MEIIIGLVVAALMWVITLYVTYVIAAICTYIWQELNHTFRNMKRDLKQSIWDLEWQWKLMKGR